MVGLGKAAASMARAVEDNWAGPLEGVVVVPKDSSLPLKHIKVLEASHPIPDESSVAAGKALMSAVTNLNRNDLVIALISGGGSALCSLPADGLLLQDMHL